MFLRNGVLGSSHPRVGSIQGKETVLQAGWEETSEWLGLVTCIWHLDLSCQTLILSLSLSCPKFKCLCFLPWFSLLPRPLFLFLSWPCLFSSLPWFLCLQISLIHRHGHLQLFLFLAVGRLLAGVGSLPWITPPEFSLGSQWCTWAVALLGWSSVGLS